MGFGGLIFAASAAMAVSQINQGYAQNAEAKANASMVEDTGRYNAALLENKAKIIDVQSDIEQGQYQRLKGQHMSKSTAIVAKQGGALQGSALAAILNTQRQINIDQSISKFNFEMDKNLTMAEAAEQRRSAGAQADALRRGGKAAKRAGYTNAFSSLLQGATTYYMYKKPVKSTTFDYSTQTPKKAT